MKISEANMNTLRWAYKFWMYIIIPIAAFSFYFDAPIINGINESSSYYIYFLFLAGAFDGMRDKCAFHFHKSIFPKKYRIFFDGEISWLNKYVDSDPSKGRRKFLKYIPIPVVLTDGWHLFKGLHTLCLVIAILFYFDYDHFELIDFVIVYGTYKWGFHLLYNFLLNKKESESNG